MSSLTIISHTEHYQDATGQLVGLGATVMEINHLLDIFDTIYHVAMLYETPPPDNCLAYASERIVFVPIPPVGGPRMLDKLSIILQMPQILKRIRATLKQSAYFQFRAPTGIGVFVVPYLIYIYRGKGWFKYAGDWSAKQSPLAFRFQQFLLRRQSRQVTINGRWPNQPAHCVSFENPCLTTEEIEVGARLVTQKQLIPGTIHLCFVGRLEAQKGLDVFLEALGLLEAEAKARVGAVHIVGGGSQQGAYIQKARKLDLDIHFHGVLSRTAVHGIFKKSHALILPSRSEGFPKVVAEALNYGCLPMVSHISAIGDYVKNGISGFLFEQLDPEYIASELQRFLDLDGAGFSTMIQSGHKVGQLFTYGHYNHRLTSAILK